MDHRIKCKLCGELHTLSEPHVFGDSKPLAAKSGGPVTSRLIERDDPGTPGKQSRPMTGRSGIHCRTCTCGEKQVYKSAAERQKAYRDRHKAK